MVENIFRSSCCAKSTTWWSWKWRSIRSSMSDRACWKTTSTSGTSIWATTKSNSSRRICFGQRPGVPYRECGDLTLPAMSLSAFRLNLSSHSNCFKVTHQKRNSPDFFYPWTSFSRSVQYHSKTWALTSGSSDGSTSATKAKQLTSM